MPIPAFSHKRGDSFVYAAVLPAGKFPDGYFAGYTLAAEARQLDGTLIAELGPAFVDDTTQQIVMSVADTTAWPLGKANFDIKLSDGNGLVVRTRTKQFLIIPEITE